MRKSDCWVVFIFAIAGPVLGMGGEWHWALDIFNHFRLQYPFILLIAIGLLLWTRCFKRAMIAAAALAGSVLAIAPYLMPAPTAAAAADHAGAPLTLLYANVLTDNLNSYELIQLIHRKNPDLVLLVEIDSRWDTQLQKGLPDYSVHEPITRDDNFGIAVFSKLPLEIEPRYFGRAGLPSFRCVGRSGNTSFTVWLTHPLTPLGREGWRFRNDQLEALGAEIRKESGPTLLVGDFNTTPWTHAFRAASGGRLQDSALGRGIHPTWPTSVPPVFRIPIDHILHSADVKILERSVLEPFGSDHLPLYARLLVASQ